VAECISRLSLPAGYGDGGHVDDAGRSGAALGSKASIVSESKTLYERLGGYDVISAVANDLLPRLRASAQIVREARERARHVMTQWEART
jgi:hypothetical protein